jgi:hypothetical protein
MFCCACGQKFQDEYAGLFINYILLKPCTTRKTIEIKRDLIDHFLVKTKNDGHATLDASHAISSSPHQKGRQKTLV